MEDNQGAINFANNYSTRRTRHINLNHHIVGNAFEEGLVRVVYLKSKYEHAKMRKTLDMITFELHVKALMNMKEVKF